MRYGCGYGADVEATRDDHLYHRWRDRATLSVKAPDQRPACPVLESPFFAPPFSRCGIR